MSADSQTAPVLMANFIEWKIESNCFIETISLYSSTTNLRTHSLTHICTNTFSFCLFLPYTQSPRLASFWVIWHSTHSKPSQHKLPSHSLPFHTHRSPNSVFPQGQFEHTKCQTMADNATQRTQKASAFLELSNSDLSQ